MSPDPPRTAAITGIGLVTPVGCDLDEFFGALCAGRSGLRRPPEGHPAAGTTDVVGLAPPIDPASVLPPRETRAVDRFLVLGVAAADRAVADAGLAVGQNADPRRVAVVVSSGGGGLETFEQYSHARFERGRAGVSSFLLPGMLSNMATARIAIKYGARGFSSAIVTACAAGAQSIAEGFRLITGGDADVVICGGTESPLHPTIVAAFGNARALASGWENPVEASRPFDKRRNGFVLGEGAGVFVLERADHARARGARVHAEVLGWGATTDAHHPTTPRPDGEGAADCMRQALDRAGLAPGDVAYINAHGTSTPLGDVAESRAIRSVFGDQDQPAVSSIKSVTGHMLGASGAVEAAASVLAVSRGLLPPTHNLDDPDPECDLNHVLGEPRAGRVPVALSNSFAFGGHNISLLFGPASSPAGTQPATSLRGGQ
ncbi:MAG TPA: beta-ketoacyl-[acyl-carrier-protein] synthase family protein [Streptosporangiaceae bacterium]|jgi:3-oxoacyl-[acyl-carrier-protein] synthase II|nr:beta-ketoacyl-[acyl-carrier-protein] synthase family protein [Streptosporangiaceae bacterium]